MKTRKLLPKNITKAFRKFNGELNLQIDGEGWITLQPGLKTNELLLAKNKNQLEYVVIDEDCNIISLKIDKYKNANKTVLKQLGDMYRHG